MALIKCPNCQKDVSSMVTYCPFCNADLTHVKASAAQSSDPYYNPDADLPSQHPENRHESEDFEDRSYRSPEVPRQSDSSSDARPNRASARSASGPSTTVSRPSTAASDTAPARRKGRRQPSYGRKLLGYRAGNPLYMLVSVCYHMAVCVGILYALSFAPQHLADGTLIFYLCRVALAAIMLLLPVLLLTEHKLHRKLPFFGSRRRSIVAVGFLLLYIPLAALFFISWHYFP